MFSIDFFSQLLYTIHMIKKSAWENITGKNHPAYKHGKCDGVYVAKRRKIAIELYGEVCNICGKSEGKIYLHHKDFNHWNNNVDNWEMLCPYCHRQVHRKYKTNEERIKNNALKFNKYAKKYSKIWDDNYTSKQVVDMLGITKQALNSRVKKGSIKYIQLTNKKHKTYAFPKNQKFIPFGRR